MKNTDKKQKLIYMGFSENLILELIEHEKFQLVSVITSEGRISRTMLKLLEVLDIPCRFVRDKNDVLELKEELCKVEMVLIYCFGIIIPKEIYQDVLCFNIHTGDLENNRGPYPLVWDILLGSKKGISVLHKLGAKIDTGDVISAYEIDIEAEDDVIVLLNKLDMGLQFHLEQLAKYDSSKGYMHISDGIYRTKVQLTDILIKPGDTLECIKRKIRSQSKYGGALLKHDNYLYRVSKIENVGEKAGVISENS